MESCVEAQYGERVLTDTGKNICDALSMMLREAKHRERVRKPIDLAPHEVHETTMHERIETHGFKQTGIGAGRVVFCVPSVYSNSDIPIVVKMARPFYIEGAGDGLSQNKYEAKTWNNAQDTKRSEWLCPVLHAPEHGRYVVMPECEVAVDSDETASIMLDIEFVVDEDTYRFELKESNVGVTPCGKSVLIDYGIQS